MIPDIPLFRDPVRKSRKPSRCLSFEQGVRERCGGGFLDCPGLQKCLLRETFANVCLVSSIRQVSYIYHPERVLRKFWRRCGKDGTTSQQEMGWEGSVTTRGGGRRRRRWRGENLYDHLLTLYPQGSPPELPTWQAYHNPRHLAHQDRGC